MANHPNFHITGLFLFLIVVIGYLISPFSCPKDTYKNRGKFPFFSLRIRATTLLGILDNTFITAAKMLYIAIKENGFHSGDQFAKSWLSLYLV